MGIIAWIVLGLLAGAVAKAILPGDDPGGLIVTMIIGIIGAVIGGLIGEWVGLRRPGLVLRPAHVCPRRRRLPASARHCHGSRQAVPDIVAGPCRTDTTAARSSARPRVADALRGLRSRGPGEPGR
jgi:uncharacterized membrane protein YeaQ/YmgE (transglycosylase-associated protein family)